MSQYEINAFTKILESKNKAQWKELQRDEKVRLNQYIEYLSFTCPISDKKIDELTSPVTITRILPPQELNTHTYEYDELLEYIEDCSAENVTAYDDVNEYFFSEDQGIKVMKRGYPTFIISFVNYVRWKLSLDSNYSLFKNDADNDNKETIISNQEKKEHVITIRQRL